MNLDRRNSRGPGDHAGRGISDWTLLVVMGVIILVIVAGYFYYDAGSSNGDNEDRMNNNENNNDQDQTKEIRVTSGQWEFSPSTFTVNEGDKVKLIFTSEDVPHGFSLQEFGVNEFISENGETIAEFTADKAGTYTFFCSVHCGAGHGDMKGTLIVN